MSSELTLRITAAALVGLLALAAPAATTHFVSGGGSGVLSAVVNSASPEDTIIITDSAVYTESVEMNLNDKTLIASPETANPTINVDTFAAGVNAAFFYNIGGVLDARLGSNQGGHITINNTPGGTDPIQIGFWIPLATSGATVTVENVSFDGFRASLVFSLSDGPLNLVVNNCNLLNAEFNNVETRGAEGGGSGGLGPGVTWSFTDCVFDGAALSDTLTLNSAHVTAVSPWDQLTFINCQFSGHQTQAVRSWFNGSSSGSINGTIGLTFDTCDFGNSVNGFPSITISGGVFDFTDCTFTQTTPLNIIPFGSGDLGILNCADSLTMTGCTVNAGDVFSRGVQVSSVLKPASLQLTDCRILDFSHLNSGGLLSSSQGIQTFGAAVTLERTIITSQVGTNAAGIAQSVLAGGSVHVDHSDIWLPYTGVSGIDPGNWGVLDLGPDDGTNWSVRNSIVRGTFGLDDLTTVPATTATFLSEYNNIFTDLDGSGPTHGGNFTPGTGDISVSSPVYIQTLIPAAPNYFKLDPVSPSATGDEFGGAQGSQGVGTPPAQTAVEDWAVYR